MKSTPAKFSAWLRKVFFPKIEIPKKTPDDGAYEFDDAIAATGFGKFNLLLMLYTIPAAAACMFDTTVMSYVNTAAECDLSLSYVNKGVLNGVTHMGMICSAFLYGYLTDTLGRKNVLVYGFLLDACCNFCAAFSQNFLMLAMLKFTSGFLVSGPCTVLATCLSEFFSTPIRAMFSMYVGICFAIGNCLLPFVAWLFLSNPSDVWIGSFVLHSWQMFIIACCLPSLITGSCATLLPESPRFLLSRGRKEEALEILKKVYAFNNSRSPDSYPVKQLNYTPDPPKKGDSDADAENKINEPAKETALSAIRGGLRQMQPLLSRPHLPILLLIIVLEFGCMTGANTLRLWFPQLSKMMSESDNGEIVLCDMISINKTIGVTNAISPTTGICVPIKVPTETFLNMGIISGLQIFFCIISSFAINAVESKKLLCSLYVAAGACALSLYWCTDALQATMLTAVAVAFNAISSNTIMTVIVHLFPTSLKAMVTSLTLMVGRIGSITGNIIFPVLLAMGCLVPFLSLGCMLFACSLLSMAIPKAKKGII